MGPSFPGHTMSYSHHATILLVEDDPAHARLIERNLRRNKIQNEIVHVKDGLEALDHINHVHPTASPIMVILDINLPILSGYQVLQRIKENKRTSHIKVIVESAV